MRLKWHLEYSEMPDFHQASSRHNSNSDKDKTALSTGSLGQKCLGNTALLGVFYEKPEGFA
jgi:hypothetical protein